MLSPGTVATRIESRLAPKLWPCRCGRPWCANPPSGHDPTSTCRPRQPAPHDLEPNPTCPLSYASDAAVQALWLTQSIGYPQRLGGPKPAVSFLVTDRSVNSTRNPFVKTKHTLWAVAIEALPVPAQADINIGDTPSAAGPAVSLGIPKKNTIELMPRSLAGHKVKTRVRRCQQHCGARRQCASPDHREQEGHDPGQHHNAQHAGDAGHGFREPDPDHLAGRLQQGSGPLSLLHGLQTRPRGTGFGLRHSLAGGDPQRPATLVIFHPPIRNTGTRP